MPSKVADVQIIGLREFRRDLKGTDPKYAARLKVANIKAADHIVRRATSRATALGGVAAKAAPSLRAVKSATQSAVRLTERFPSKGSRKSFELGAEFGASRYKQFKPHKGTEGYFLYPTIRAEREYVTHIYARAVDSILKQAFPK